MKKIAAIILITFSVVRGYSQHPYIQPLKELAVITFPDTPKTGFGNGLVYSTTFNYNYYVSQVNNLPRSFKTMFITTDEDSVYANFITSTLKTNSGKLLYKNKIKRQGLNGVEYAYSLMVDSAKNFRYRQLFYFNNTLILNGISSVDSLKHTDTLLTHYFNTFKITIRNNQIRQSNSNIIGKAIGYALGILLAIAAIITLVTFIIRSSQKRTAAKNTP